MNILTTEFKTSHFSQTVHCPFSYTVCMYYSKDSKCNHERIEGPIQGYFAGPKISWANLLPCYKKLALALEHWKQTGFHINWHSKFARQLLNS